MRMFISASILVRSPHQGRLLSLQKVTLYWLPIDRFAAEDVFFCLFISVPFSFCLSRSLFMSLIIHLFSNALRHCRVYFVVLFLSFFSPCYIPQTPFDIFLSFLVIFNSSSLFLPLHSSSIIYLRAAPSRVLLWVPSGADHSQSRRSAHVLVCVNVRVSEPRSTSRGRIMESFRNSTAVSNASEMVFMYWVYI